jgi:hypothetical protein
VSTPVETPAAEMGAILCTPYLDGAGGGPTVPGSSASEGESPRPYARFLITLCICRTLGVANETSYIRYFVSFLSPLCQFLLEHDDFLQGVRMVLPLELQFVLKVGVALFEPFNVLLPEFQLQ